MQPLTRIGLARLVGLFVCASEVVLAAGTGYGCRLTPATCPPKTDFAFGVLKCHRCSQTRLALMDQENTKHLSENQPLCQKMVVDGHDGGDYQFYHTSEEVIDECDKPSFLLYDGVVECYGLRGSHVTGTVVGVFEKCIGQTYGFYNCLCDSGIDDFHIQYLEPCFHLGEKPIMRTKCANQYQKPPLTRRKGKGPKQTPQKINNRRSTVDDGSNTNSNSASNGEPSDGSDDGSDDGPNTDYFVDDWPPNLDNQFSPVLKDTDVSFYLDVWERIVLVDTDTNEVRYYEPYYLYTALSYDTVLPAEDKDTGMNLLRRCWLYPYSSRVWCYQWEVPTTELRQLGYKDSNTATILGPSAAAAGVTASAGETALPTTSYTSVEYETAGPIPSAKSRTVTNTPDTTASAGSTARPTKGSSSAPASRPGSKSWLAGILAAIIMYDAL